MRAHPGAAITGGLTALAVALALFQAAVMAHGAPRAQMPTARHSEPTNRYSAPGNRSAIPWAPFDRVEPPAPLPPESPEGRTPRRQQEEHRAPPPARFRGMPPRIGPQPTRKVAV